MLMYIQAKASLKYQRVIMDSTFGPLKTANDLTRRNVVLPFYKKTYTYVLRVLHSWR